MEQAMKLLADKTACRRALSVANAALAGAVWMLMLCTPQAARAQQFPTKTITIVVGFAPGGFIDTISRLVAQKLSERLGQPVVVENRAGAGGNLAHRIVAAAPPDGHTILAATTSIAINESLYKNHGYTAADFTTLAISASTAEIIVTHPNGPKSLKEMLDGATAKAVNYGTAGAGSASYIVTEYFFRNLARVPAQHVPFQGGGPLVNAALAHHIDLAAAAMAGGFVPHVQAGSLRGLAIASEKRMAVVADVPTYSELGFPLTATSWAGFFAPAKTPPHVIAKLNSAMNELMKEPDVLGRLTPIGFEPIYGSPAQADAMFRSEIAKWGQMVDAIGLRID
jgi:tripartite-type tricarboxylate transporter receptor subunit TctC